MELINKKYKKLEIIGEGTFGLIYKGHNVRTNECVAIKVESIEKETKLLKNESIIYQYLNNIPGIPSVKWFGKDDRNYYMVLNLLGESLQSIKNKKDIFSLKLVLQIGIHILELLKTIHNKGLVHRDIKPDNFLVGLNDKRKTIYMIDFGLCKTFIKDDKHIEERKTKSLIGSQMYASINAHHFIELSRRDDIESLGYMLIYFYLGSLSWQTDTDADKIIKMKQEIINETKIPLILINYMKYVRSLEFNEKPNYYLLSDIFKREVKSM
jgi:serine/threonine protein kinase